LEKRIKEFLNAEDCCIYSFGFATVSSAIPAFSARGDLLIVDKGVSYALQTGVKLSRSDVIWYEHNDMKDLERILKQVDQEDKKTKRKIPRRFIVTEGLFFNHGDVAPLDKIMELKNKYYYRIILDDSYGLGVLGKTGRGTCELYNINPRDIDILTGNLEGATSSVGGFCCGARNVIYHQRLNSSGYVYSCSLPPLLASASITALDILDQDPGLVSKLAENTKYFVNGLKNISGVTVTSSTESPIIHLRLSKVAPQNETERLTEERTLQNIVKEALNRGILLTRAKYVHHYEYFMPVPSIRICVSAIHTKEQLQNALNVIKESTEKALKNNSNNKK
jgi:serine palmitoyltransferase